VAASPELLPPASAEAAGWPGAGSDDALRAAVTYVAGMTDRYAIALAERWLGWDPVGLVVSAT
jgi:dGTPase